MGSVTSWEDYLHHVRRQEVERIFGRCPPKVFAVGLELGAGDGYQSALLEAYAERLVVTDWDVQRLRSRRSATVEVHPCDAERVAEQFPAGSFDLVFSSNLLEHLPNPGLALRGIHTILKEDGVTVHVMPAPAWKLCDLALTGPVAMGRAVRRVVRGRPAGVDGARGRGGTNNPKQSPSDRRRIWQRLWPDPHGAYSGHWEEVWAYRRRRWERELGRAGFEVVSVLRGPVASGYGLGWDRLRRALDALGVATEYAYAATKRGARSPYARYWGGTAR
jgi:SAM-dependent methyltransferase